MHTNCIFCGANVALVHVHGHYQCPMCKTNALPCCDADNCDNFLLTAQFIENTKPAVQQQQVINISIKSNGG
jgi:hypothetical protein